MNSNNMLKRVASKPTDNPLVLFWIAHYNDGTSLPQFDIYNYKTNNFNDIEQTKLIKFGYYPFTPNLAEGVSKQGDYTAVSHPFLPKYEINLDNDKRLIGGVTRNWIETSTFHVCKKCNKEFKYKPGKTEELDSQYKSPICPNCGAHDIWKCPACGKTFNKFEDANRNHCTECNKLVSNVKITSGTDSRQRKWKAYLLGFQQTIGNKNYKVINLIHENGDVEVKYE